MKQCINCPFANKSRRRDYYIFILFLFEMNIYWLINTFPRPLHYNDLARLYCDQDVLKTIEDITYMLYMVWHVYAEGNFPDVFLRSISGGPMEYNAEYIDHPMTKWVGKCLPNYCVTSLLGLSLCDEYLLRFPASAPHACQVHIEALSSNVPPSIPKKSLAGYFIPPICGVPEKLRWSSCLSMGEIDCHCCHHYSWIAFDQYGNRRRHVYAHNPADSYRKYYTKVKMFEMDQFTYTNVPVPQFVLNSFRDELHDRLWKELWPSLRLILHGHMREKECPFYLLPLETVGLIERYILSWPYVKCSSLK